MNQLVFSFWTLFDSSSPASLRGMVDLRADLPVLVTDGPPRNGSGRGRNIRPCSLRQSRELALLDLKMGRW